MNDGQKKEIAVELSVPQAEEEETVNKQSTTILEQVRQGPKNINKIFFFFSPLLIQFLTHYPMYFFCITLISKEFSNLCVLLMLSAGPVSS